LSDVVVTEDDIGTVADVYRSGWLSLGPRTGELEQALSSYTGSADAVAVSSGTAALHLICLGAGLGPGDEVIVPSMTFVATGSAGAFSFFSNKNLAVGEGGAIATDDADLAERLRLLRSHGMTSLSWDRHKGHASGYDVVALGFNYRIDEPRAALAAARLQRLD